MQKLPCCPAILNIVAEMDIAGLPNHVLCMWLETGHIYNTPKVEETHCCSFAMDFNYTFKWFLHLQTQDAMDLAYVLLSEKASLSPKKQKHEGKRQNCTGLGKISSYSSLPQSSSLQLKSVS